MIEVLIINIYQLQRIVMESPSLEILKSQLDTFFSKDSLQFKQESIQSLETHVTTGNLNRWSQWSFAMIIGIIEASRGKTTLPWAQRQKQKLVCG